MTEAAERAAFQSALAVPYETMGRFDRYAELLASWQSRMNLVAPSTLPHVWTRHFLDSAQLLPLIPADARNVVDLGSGAGFPGLVLALLGARDVHLIEATRKKADFLRAVASELDIPVTIHNERTEAVKHLQADVVTARAVAELKDLLRLAQHFLCPKTVLLFQKGAKAGQEVAAAHRCWRFELEKATSRTDDSGSVLILRRVRFLHEVAHARSR